MRKMTIPLAFAAAALITAAGMSVAFNAMSVHAQNRPAGSYAEERDEWAYKGCQNPA